MTQANQWSAPQDSRAVDSLSPRLGVQRGRPEQEPGQGRQETGPEQGQREQERPEQGRPETGTGERRAGGGPGATLRVLLQKWKFWLLVAGLLVLVVTVTFLARSAGTDRGALSPANPAPEGAMAVAEILRQQGVNVQYTETIEATRRALESAGSDDSTLLLHDRLQLLTGDQLNQLPPAAATVLIEPSVPILNTMAAGVDSAGVVPAADEQTLAPKCSVNDALAAGEVDRGGFSYRGTQTCYPSGESGDPPGTYVQTDDGVTVLGYGAILSNDRLLNHGNAALALRTLGQEPNLVWYQPSLADVVVTDQAPTIGELVPAWVNLALLWAAIVALIAMLWKGRRLGPLVTEPLPVTARVSETAEGRARLYQDSRAVHRAAENLRAGTLTRLAAHLRLGAGPSAEAVVRAASATGARPAVDIHQLLHQLPATETELLRWAQQLEALEKEVTAR